MTNIIEQVKERARNSMDADMLYLLQELEETQNELASALQSRDDYKQKWKKRKKAMAKLVQKYETSEN